jgi:hypothetical protein
MASDLSMTQTRFGLSDGMDLAGMGMEELWWRYAALGGRTPPALVADRINGLAPSDEDEYNLIAQALNEGFLDRGLDTFPVGYCGSLADAGGMPSPQVLAGQASAAPPIPPAEARRRAAEARRRSATAARQAAQLHLTAARLMQTGGQLQFARHARQRADNAHARAAQAAMETANP